jgi:uncharacterized DUF497 family protein
VTIEFDPAKDARNREKHGVSLAYADQLEILATEPDDRVRYGEERWRSWGRIEGVDYCLAFTVRRGRVRAISLRRASRKEMARHVPQAD